MRGLVVSEIVKVRSAICRQIASATILTRIRSPVSRLRPVLQVTLPSYMHRTVTIITSVVFCCKLGGEITANLRAVNDDHIVGCWCVLA